jgi:uncharacterized protein (DUF2141 family)
MRDPIKICLVALSFAMLSPVRAGTLIVEVRGFEDATGQAMVEVYSSRSGFLREPALSESQPLVAGEPARWRFDDLAPSDYAVRVWHDSNANGEPDRPTFGRNETFAFSRGVTDVNPEWGDVTVMLGPDPVTVSIDLSASDD